MPDFSKLLNTYIKRQGMSIRVAADFLNVNRTTLQHIISGDRNFKNLSTVYNVADKLMLSSDEKTEFINKYRISVMGEDVYNRRMMVQSVIRKLEAVKPFDLSGIKVATGDKKTEESVITFDNQMQLDKFLRNVLKYEAAAGSEIFILAQPSEYLNTLLYSCIDNPCKSQIRHYFCMDNNFDVNASNVNNLSILGYTYILASTFEGYTPLYYYDNLNTHFNSTSLMPFCILTGDCVIAMEYDYSKGIAYFDGRVNEFYHTLIQKYEAVSQNFVVKSGNFFDMIKSLRIMKIIEFEYSTQPCIPTICTTEMLNECMNLPQELKLAYLGFADETYPAYAAQHPVSYFTEDGLREFVEEGNIFCVPHELYTNPDKSVRRQILNRIIDALENDVIHYRCFKNNDFSARGNLLLHVSKDSIRVCESGEGGTILLISEPSLVYSFCDYFNYINESGFVCTKQETLDILKKYLGKI